MRKFIVGILAVFLFAFTYASTNQVITIDQGKAPPDATCFSLPDMDLSLAVMPVVVGYGWEITYYNSVPVVWFATMPGIHKAYLADVVQPPDLCNQFWQVSDYNYTAFYDERGRARDWVLNIITDEIYNPSLNEYARDRLTYINSNYVAAIYKDIHLTSCAPPFY